MPKQRVTARDRQRLERALCTLADYESLIKQALIDAVRDGANEHDLRHVCAALRAIVDDGFGNS